MRHSFITTLSIILTVALATAFFPAPAVHSEAFLNAIAREETPHCPTEIFQADLKKAVEDFSTFMTNHFRNQADASALLPAAIDRFRISYKLLKSLPDRISINQEDASKQTLVFQEKQDCEKLINNNLFAMKQTLKAHILANAAAKRSTKLIDAYKAINKKLDTLNLTVAQFYGYFLTFSNKLRCYARNCN